MKVVCIDKDINIRTELKILVQSAFDCIADNLSYPQVNIFSTPVEELLVNSAPDVLCFYAKDKIDDVLLLCKELESVHPAVPKVIFLHETLYNLKNLNRIENNYEVLSAEEKNITVVHKLCSIAKKSQQVVTGALINVLGAKGGVGASTLVASLAHAFSAYGKRAVIVDLSATSSLLHYLGAEKCNSPEYTILLKDDVFPDYAIFELILTTTPCGVSVLLPPFGGTDVRELWLRDTKRFEISLSLIETLRKRFDVVIIDNSRSEGILPFALQSRANMNLLVSSSEPASIYHLNQKLSVLLEGPGNFKTGIVINNVSRPELGKRDILDFLYVNSHFNEDFFDYPDVPYDTGGKRWIGSGNTFYSECGAKARGALDTVAYLLLERCGLVSEGGEEMQGGKQDNRPDSRQGVVDIFKDRFSAMRFLGRKLQHGRLLEPLAGGMANSNGNSSGSGGKPQ